jgi:mannitol/fructose-specific phosphotransferase system IIA component
MVQALVQLNDETNRVLNVVKAKHGFRDKAEAIEFVVHRYVEFEEPELKPEFIEKMKRIEKQPSIRVKDFAKRYAPN